MKKLILVVIIGLLVGTAAFADHPGFGIGIVGGGGWGGVGTGHAGLSLKIPGVPVFWGLYFPFYADSHYFAMGVTGDFYFFDSNLVSKDLSNEDGSYKFKLDWYLGVGGFLSFRTWHGNGDVDFGVRVPVGLSWHIIKQVELFFGIHPGLGIHLGNDWWGPVYFQIGGELGLRFWFGA
ncbi:MAG: hypothetical protein LBU85_08535 [Treponema sp.]|jgi:hypothetical protein|nr:hypothetical protein [Treponema sp.]